MNYDEILRDLADRTDQGLVTWRALPQDSVFIVRVGPCVVRSTLVDTAMDGVGSEYPCEFRATVTGPEGRVLYILEAGRDDRQGYDFLARLWEVARESALGVKKHAREMATALERGDTSADVEDPEAPRKSDFDDIPF